MGILAVLAGIIMCIAPIAVISLIISAIAKKNKEEKNSFEDLIRSVYIYIILIIALIAIIGGTITIFRVGLDIILPEQYAEETRYSSQERERNENVTEVLTTISIVATMIPIFIYHNNLAKELRKNKSVEQSTENIVSQN